STRMLLRAPLAEDAGEGGEDPHAGFDEAAQGPGELRLSGEAAAIGHRQFEDPETGAGCAHLHFEVPAVGHLAHAEVLQGIGADCPQSAHVRIPHPIDKADRGADRPAGERLMNPHAALLAATPGAGADDKIVLLLDYRLDQ